MQKIRLLLGIWLLFSCSLLAQETTYTLSGYVKDMDNGENLIGASVYSAQLKVGTLTNEYGFFSLRLRSEDSVKVIFSYAGYTPGSKTYLLKKDLQETLYLTPETSVLDEVVIEGKQTYKEEIASTQMGLATISVREAKLIPALGEVDILKTLQLKPGVQSGGEGQAGIFVRGGSNDQNLIVLDEAVVYNATHLFGLFSTFNSDAVKDVNLYKGGFPAQYGGRLSSVIDVRLKEGNRQRFAGSGGIGLIASRLTLEGPIKKEKGSFILSGRRTYFDLITRQINRANENNDSDDGDGGFSQIPDYYFYDLNAKVNYDLGENDRIFISGYFGRDVFGFDDDNFNFDFLWGNVTTTARWNHLFNSRLFVNTTFTYSDYDYVIRNEFAQAFRFEVGSQIRDMNLKTDFYWLPNEQHTIRYGVNVVRHEFDVGRLEAGSDDGTINFSAGQSFVAEEFGVYVADDYEVNDKLKVNVGARISGFHNSGTWYWGFEPRFSARYSLSEKVSFKAGVTRMFQYIHLVGNSAASLPTDVWYPSNERIKPQSATQVAGGITFQLGEQWLVTNEVFYKWLGNQVDFRDGAQLFVNDNLDDEFVFGRGWAYGNELYIQKKVGRITGWIGYTLAWSWRVFDGTFSGEFRELDAINEGRKFHPRFDRRHDVSVVALYELNDRWSLTATWVYGTGNAITLPTGRAVVLDPITSDPRLVPIYEDRNSFRAPAYHRMDAGVVYNMTNKWGSSDLTLSFYNLYNRRNAYFIFIEDDFETLQSQARQVQLFPIIPSITYNFKF
ncbi:MAG: TonB-dependent receptor [Bacteroidota bacterium]